MKLKNYFVIFSLFFILICTLGAISAVSNDTMENIASGIDFDDSISLSNDDGELAIDEKDSKVNTPIDDNETISQSFDDNVNVLTEKTNQIDEKLSASGSSKSNLKIVNYTNFVKKGKTYYFYLTDLKGKSVANKNLTINFEGQNYVKTTNAYGKVGISIKSSAASGSMKISFKGDSQYNSFIGYSNKDHIQLKKDLPLKRVSNNFFTISIILLALEIGVAVLIRQVKFGSLLHSYLPFLPVVFL